MTLEELILEKIRRYALDGQAYDLERYSFLFEIIAKDYAADKLAEAVEKMDEEKEYKHDYFVNGIEAAKKILTSIPLD